MFTSDELLQIFIVIIVINIAVLELAVFLLWRRRPVGVAPSSGDDAAASSVAARIDTLVGSPSEQAAAADEPKVDLIGTDVLRPELSEDGVNGADPAGGDEATLVDPATGLESVLVWHDALRHEDARRARYGHPATVLVLELVNFDGLVDRLGAEVADRIIVPVAATLLANSRASDRVARVGHTRFHVLMPHADEVRAINYVDRIRERTDLWLEAGAVATRVAIGWASPPVGGSLADALRLAEERMVADRVARLRPRTVTGSRAEARTPAA
jgi:diguanylate cyclase (GGDEF)-like protein